MRTQKLFQAKPRTEEDVESAKQNEILLNYQWETEVDKQKLVETASRMIVDNGTVICKTLWESEYGTKIVEKEQPVWANPEESMQMMQQAVEAGQMSQEQAQAMVETGQLMQKGTEKVYVEEETLIKNGPLYEVRNSANVYIDPTCEGIIANAQFVVDEFQISWADLKKNEYDKESGTGYYKNLDQINVDSESDYDEYATNERQSFKFNDKPRKEMTAYEYWGYWDIYGDDTLVPIVATWIGRVMVRMEENPFPHKRIPYSMATYMPVKMEIHGEPNAEITKENQDVIAKQTRAAIDITATQAVNQEFIAQNLFPNSVERNNYENGKKVYTTPGVDPRQAIFKQTVTPVPSAVFDMIAFQGNEVEALSGTRAFNNSEGKLGSATAERGAMDATSKRKSGVLRRMAAMFKDMARMTVANNQALMPEEQIIRITNDFVKIRRDDLEGKVDIQLEISTPEKNQLQADKLIMLLQTNAMEMPNEIMVKMYAKLMLLWDQPDLADQLENYQPQPDPAEEQMKQLQLETAQMENEKIKMEIAKLAKDIEEASSRISERASKEAENHVDVQNKQAQAQERIAKTELINAQTDLLDAEFIDKDARDSRQEQLDDQIYAEEMKTYRDDQKNKTALANPVIGESKKKTTGEK